MRLYKYYSATKWSYEALRDFKFYFSRFNELNDPYELSLTNCDKDKLQSIKFKFLDPKDPNGIFCLSNRIDNSHMWTHYADGHRGFAVEFETEDDKDFFSQLNNVTYANTPPMFHEEMKVREIVFQKGLDSMNESEWRIFGKNRRVPINPKAVKTVIFGWRFPVGCSTTANPPDYLVAQYKNRRKELKAIINLDKLYWENKLPVHIDFYQTVVNHNSYNLGLSAKWVRPQIKY